jgi:glycosyl transferase family (putative galactosyltransferase)
MRLARGSRAFRPSIDTQPARSPEPEPVAEWSARGVELVRMTDYEPGDERKVLCTIATGPHADLFELSGPSFAIFAERHGYDLAVRRVLTAPDREPSWNKLPFFLELFEEYDLVVWVDADAAIVDPSSDIAEELGPEDLMGVVAHEYDDQVIPNCGVWVLRNDDGVREFVERLWNRTEFLDHRWWENAAFLDELGYQVDPRVDLVRPTPMLRRTRFIDRSWNSIRVDEARHPRINHYPGRSQAHRLQELERDLSQARAAASEWDVAPQLPRVATS